MDYLNQSVFLYKPFNDIFYFKKENVQDNIDFYSKLTNILSKNNDIVYNITSSMPSIWLRDYFPIEVDNKFYSFIPSFTYMTNTEKKKYNNYYHNILRLYNKEINKIDIILDGGNIIYNSNLLFISEKIFLDNCKMDRNKIISILENIFNNRKIIFIKTDEHDITSHADGFMNFLSENVLLINNIEEYCKDIFYYNFNVISKYIEPILIPSINIEERYHKWYSNKGNYINFLATKNNIVLSTYGYKDVENKIIDIIKKNDSMNRTIEFIDSSVIDLYGGGLHCITKTI